MRKKILLMLLMMAMLSCVFAIFASAAQLIDGIYYNFSGTEASVAGTNQKSCQLAEVVIPERVTFEGTEYTVTKIESKAFGSQNAKGGNANVKSVVIPSTVTSMGIYAFGNCPNITTVHCKATAIGERAFFDCNQLATLTLENTVEIGVYAFTRISITTLILPSTVTNTGSSSFKACNNLTRVVVLGSVLTADTFDSCTSITELVLTENIEPFTDALPSASSSIKFVTFYTGSDYEYIEGISSSSRFTKAGNCEYKDYEAGTYTGNMIVYNCNLCDVVYNGVHIEPQDDGDCTTAVICSVCADYTYKEAKEHISSERVTYLSFLENGEHYVGCTNDGCAYGTTEKLDALFSCQGYSSQENGNGGIAIGFTVNSVAVAKYNEITGKTVKYGVFAVSQNKLGSGDIFGKNGAAAGVISAEITAYNFTAFELKIIGFTAENMNTKLALGAYVAVSDGNTTEYSYMQDDTKGELTGKYYFASYNEIVAKAS